jgi:hypothetical protein
MKRLIILIFPFLFWSCGQEGAYFINYAIQSCDDSVSETINVFQFKDRITHQKFEKGILNLSISFMDNCILDMSPGVENYGDTVEISVDNRTYEADYEDLLAMCDCCFGLDMEIGGLEEVNQDSLVVILNCKNKHSYPDTFQLVVSDEITLNYDQVDFAIVRGDTLFYEWEDSEALNDSLIRIFRDEERNITSSFENDYGLNYDYSNDEINLRTKYGRYYLRNSKTEIEETGTVSYSEKIILPSGQVGYEAFFQKQKIKPTAIIKE